MFATLQFIVEGSTGNEYEIVASRNGNNFKMTCTCEAGQNGIYCKHRFALMDGCPDRLISNNDSDLSKLKEMLFGTEVEKRYKIVVELERQKAEIEARLKAEKKALAREITE